MKLIFTVALLLTPALSPLGHVPGPSFGAGGQQTKESSAPPQDMTVEDEADCPVRLSYLAGWAVPEHKHLTELEFVPQDVSAKPIKAYTVRVHETWRDAQRGDGKASHTMPYKTAPNPEAHRIVFRVHRTGKVKVWVASVEYEDGGVWESKVIDPDKEGRKGFASKPLVAPKLLKPASKVLKDQGVLRQSPP